MRSKKSSIFVAIFLVSVMLTPLQVEAQQQSQTGGDAGICGPVCVPCGIVCRLYSDLCFLFTELFGGCGAWCAICGCGPCCGSCGDLLAPKESVETEPEPALGSVEGQVTDSVGNPVAGAKVSIDGISTVADGEGNFSFIGLYPGDYTVTASAEGETAEVPVIVYENFTTYVTIALPLEPVAVPEVGEIQQPTIEVPEETGKGSIIGYVKTGEVPSSPVSGATVTLSKGSRVDFKSTVSDISGRFVFENLEPGDYIITVTKGIHTAFKNVTVYAGETTVANIELG